MGVLCLNAYSILFMECCILMLKYSHLITGARGFNVFVLNIRSRNTTSISSLAFHLAFGSLLTRNRVDQFALS